MATASEFDSATSPVVIQQTLAKFFQVVAERVAEFRSSQLTDGRNELREWPRHVSVETSAAITSSP